MRIQRENAASNMDALEKHANGQAQKQIFRVIGDAIEKDREMDDTLLEHKNLAEFLRAEIKEAKDALQEIEARKAEVAGTADEKERLLAFEKEGEFYHGIVEQNQRRMEEELSIVRGLKQARLSLERQPMQEAQEQADKIRDAASNEIIGMIMEDAKNHIDEVQKEKEEEAKKAQQSKEEKEEQIEAIKQKTEEMKAQAETRDRKPNESDGNMTDLLTDEILEISQGKTEVQQEIENIINKMNLIEEDLKGAAVDQTV